MVIRLWLNLPTGAHDRVISMCNLGRDFSRENTPEGCTETHKSSLFPYKQRCYLWYNQASERNGDHEWLRMTNASYYVIYYEKFRKIMQQTEQEALKCQFDYFYCYPWCQYLNGATYWMVTPDYSVLWLSAYANICICMTAISRALKWYTMIMKIH